ncbi:nuclease-related domain-containing protein [Bacillus sp. CGMCC 1.16607]|uniref:nuclease-related domain-containing protein n=1 Tax=Bacillus sp. CGMCC 1.16607 TaxID=3351842 RepID=UPI003634FE6F
MFLRQRFETEELKLFRLLNKRIQLSRKDLNYYLNLEKGFEGELKFDERLKSLTSDHLILSDLLFEINNSFFQIDALLIISKTIYLFDIKNFEGDYYLDSGSWYTLSKSEIKDPLAQLKRSETLLRRMIQDLKLNFSIEAYLVFVNTDFYLYQAPLNLPIIFPSQIDRFMKKINLSESKLLERHLKFAEKLLSHHLEKSPFTRVPVYTYDELNVDVICSMCNSFNVGVVENILI